MKNKNLLLLLLSIIISLTLAAFLGEIYLRSTQAYVSGKNISIFSWNIPIDINPPLVRKSTTNNVLLYPNTQATINNHWTSGKTVFIRINSLGFRGPEVPVNKTADEVRILVLGDSITLGDYLPEKYVYPSILQRQIQSAIPGKKIAIINAGVADIGTKEELDILETDGLKIKPDFVVLSYFLNDSRPPWGFSGENEYRSVLERHSLLFGNIKKTLTLNKYLSSSKTDRMKWVNTKPGWSWPGDQASFLKFATEDAGFDWGAAWIPENWPIISSEFGRLDQLSKQHRFRVVIVNFPVTYQFREAIYDDTPQKYLKKAAAEYGFPVLDLLPLIDREDAKENLYFDHCHPNEKGNAVAAGAVAEFLIPMILPTAEASPTANINQNQ